jgi:hypothetical protein
MAISFVFINSFPPKKKKWEGKSRRHKIDDVASGGNNGNYTKYISFFDLQW